jgi:hypothetical protein
MIPSQRPQSCRLQFDCDNDLGSAYQAYIQAYLAYMCVAPMWLEPLRCPIPGLQSDFLFLTKSHYSDICLHLLLKELSMLLHAAC